MSKCDKCISNIDGYCIEKEELADKKKCGSFIDKSEAEALCDLICPCFEDEE